MDYAKLKSLILTMPGYSVSTTDADVLAWLTTPSIDKHNPVSKSQLLQWAAQKNRIGKLETGTTNSNSDISNLCKAALKLMTAADVSSFDTGDPINVSLLDQLVAAGVFDDVTDKDKADLMALGYSQVSPAEDNGFSGLSEQIIATARGW